ncbi:serine hydrolase domain-containing protein [Kitasatospora sp. NPDC101157]|uniref:serine hydrolase domain-containing protein n=1 Tax=Kitasatospora sp. NPDC101157 TaxID=3364098 RepID=UPI0037FD0870
MAIAKPAALALAGLLLAAASTPALAAGSGRPTSGPDKAALGAAIAFRPGDPTAGVIARVTVDGQTWRGSDDDPVSGQPVAPNAAFRIGSINKTFVAAVLLQLAAEQRVDLDGTVQQYLPGVLPDGSGGSPAYQSITVRQLLDHTSGLPPVVEGPGTVSNSEMIAQRFGVETFEEVVQRTLRPTGSSPDSWPRPVFAPGTEQQYNNFNYRLAGLLIERVTGHSLKQEVTARILGPLHLRHTELTDGAPKMPEPHLTGYFPDDFDTPTDVSEQGGNPESMVSTPADLDRFLRALLDGELLPPQQLHDLLTLPRDTSGQLLPYHGSGDCQLGPNKGKACYSVGLLAIPLQDGTTLWGKTGHDLGYSDGIFATADGRKRLVYSVGVGAGAPAPALRLAAATFGPFAR